MRNTIDLPLITAVHKLQHQAVRDLAWCCFSAPLMHKLPDSEAAMLPFTNQQLWPWLYALDQQPEPLLAHIAQVKSTRLGIYYETLWRFYFSHQPEWELLQHNLQVERNGATLGAFDFLCRRGNEYWHIETAVKFYLCDTKNEQDAHHWHHWIGPSSQDRLDLKLAHLCHHQLPLHQTAEAKIRLQTLFPQANDWKTGLCLQGYLFSPVSIDYRPAFSHENQGRGHWWYLQDFLDYLLEERERGWIIVERQRWLSPIHTKNCNELMCNKDLAQQLQKQIGEIKRPLLLAAMVEINAGGNYWQEDWRGFIVPDTWPGN